MAWSIYRKDSDRRSLQCDLDCYSLKVGIQLDWLVVEPFLYVDGDSTTWKLISPSPESPVVAVIVSTPEVRLLGVVLQLGFLEANNLRLELFHQDVKISSVSS